MALNIKRVMKEYHVTGQTVAERMNITPASLSAHINGNPSAAVLENIAQAIGCEVGEFFQTSQRPWFLCPHCHQKVYVDTVEHSNGTLVEILGNEPMDEKSAAAFFGK